MSPGSVTEVRRLRSCQANTDMIHVKPGQAARSKEQKGEATGMQRDHLPKVLVCVNFLDR